MQTKLKPDWAGGDWLSRAVNVLIQTKPIYAVMKQQARKVLIQTAEKNGVAWRQTYADLNASGIQAQLADRTNPGITYPDYYNVPFHAYDAGNLCWDAAFEAESATYAMALRIWPDESLTWQAAQDRLRDSFHQAIAQYRSSRRSAPIQDILDIGCSVGLSTLPLHRFYQAQNPQVSTTGLDLSPYMLTVAQHRDSADQITWMHANAEATGLLDNSFDLITLQFLIHELPRKATATIVQECYRLLRSGGTLAIVDNNPQSKVIQNLPPVLFTLMKSTEPWTDDYYTFDVVAGIAPAGFDRIQTLETDPRHRTILATKP
jgi:ubiquinone/menaquinone biosynthesis C-methylase UbiE